MQSIFFFLKSGYVGFEKFSCSGGQ